MTDHDDEIAMLEAELEMKRLERQLADEKAASGEATADTKHALRAARQAYRGLRDGTPLTLGEARPDAIKTAATVKER